MADWDIDFRTIFDRATEKFRQQNHDDLQNEIAGRDTGRMKRFLPNGHSAAQSSRDKQDEDALTALQILLLNDPTYAALYADTWDLLNREDLEAERVIKTAEAALANALDKAAHLPDGRAVFLDKDGNARTPDGQIVDAAIAAEIVWSPDSFSYESYVQLQDTVDEWRQYQVGTLGRIRDRMEDGDNPVSADEMRGFQSDIKTQRPERHGETQDWSPNNQNEASTAPNDIQVLDF